MSQGDPVDITYLDFQKTFDKISHHVLVTRLSSNGITGQVLLQETAAGSKWAVLIIEESKHWVPPPQIHIRNGAVYLVHKQSGGKIRV